jgi:hypothetical protein
LRGGEFLILESSCYHRYHLMTLEGLSIRDRVSSARTECSRR